MSAPNDKSVEAEVLATMREYGTAMEAGDVNALLACCRSLA